MHMFLLISQTRPRPDSEGEERYQRLFRDDRAGQGEVPDISQGKVE